MILVLIKDVIRTFTTTSGKPIEQEKEFIVKLSDDADQFAKFSFK